MQYLAETAGDVLENRVVPWTGSSWDAPRLMIYVDADHASDPDQTRSTTGGLTRVESVSGTTCLLAWLSRLQSVTALSTCEAELVAGNTYLASCGLPVAVLFERYVGYDIPITMWTDNEAFRCAARNPSTRLRYIVKTHRLRLGWLQDLVSLGVVTISRISSEDNPADIGTKPLARVRFAALRAAVGLRPGRFPVSA